MSNFSNNTMRIKVDKNFILNGYDVEIDKVHKKLKKDIYYWKEWKHGLSGLKTILDEVTKMIELMKAKEKLENINALNFDIQLNYNSKGKK